MNSDIQLDLGTVKVHKHVLEDIIANTVKEISGVNLVKLNVTNKIFGLLGSKSHPGIRINIDENRDIQLELKVDVRYGENIPELGRQIQDIVKQDIKKTLDIEVKDVDIDIQGIERG